MNSGQESISTIKDSLNNMIDTENDPVANTGNKGTVDYIINKNINNLEDYLNTKVINIYQRPWNKLELKLKIRKINEYFQNGPYVDSPPSSPTVNKKKSSKKGVEAFENFESSEIISFCKTNEKKRLKVEYDQQECNIKSIIVSN
jgi:hypothetical protein